MSAKYPLAIAEIEVIETPDAVPGTFKSYLTGYLLSLYLTFTAYEIVRHNLFSGGAIVIALATAAVIQLVIQLIFFLHLNKGSQRRYNILIFLFMALVVGILVGGSLWIITNLNGRHNESPESISKYLQSQDGL